MKNLSMVLVACLIGIATTVSAQWQLNEVLADTDGGIDVQFVELYNPTAGQSVTGLTLVAVRTSNGDVSSSQTLTGTATGNFFLLVNDIYTSESFSPAGDQVADDQFFLRDGLQEILLVNTSDFSAADTNYDGTEYNNGADIIDILYLVDQPSGDVDNLEGVFVPLSQTADIIFGPDPDNFFIEAGGYRDTDGSGAWQALDFPPAATLPDLATPGATNANASVEGWKQF
ncbi:MAG: hypothetical protein RLY93_10390 [Sumerlaeia bacterium]